MIKPNKKLVMLLVTAVLLVLPIVVTATLTITGDVTISGDLDVTGALSKGFGSFMIDHPLDPKNKLLFHSFVESPDVKNVYTGVAVLNENGEVTVQLPKYFEALNKDFRYQFFPKEGAMPNLYIGQRIQNNQFTISGGIPSGKVSWQVTGIRQDPYILENPIITEVEKGSSTPVGKGECLFKPLCE
jgi:hypothetical protein